MLLQRFRYIALIFLLAGCAAGVVFAPAEMTAAAPQQPRSLSKAVEVVLDTGYSRTLAAGSQWVRVGSIAQGEVYKSHGGVFTLEGKHVHEAYLVTNGDMLVGFYLPVERGFSPLQKKIQVTLN
jgi:hypothetical protein